jgi:putative transposase
MIDQTHTLPVAAQCRLLEVSRGCVYYRPAPIAQADLRLMRRIDELHLEFPFFGSRRLLVKLREDGFEVGRRHLVTLMRRMGLEALYRKPRTSLGNRQHKVYPYLLREVVIARPNQVWAADITYIPMAKGFGYLVAIIDVFSRKELAHRLSNTMTTDFCVEALEEALARFGAPRSSTPIRARSSPMPTSPTSSKNTPSPSAWTARAAGSTTCSSSGCGARSSTRTCT